MMRSLWAGVTGLQAHQIAMDVEGNNIANVNTTGFKYSRANFSDLLNQTAKIATAPQGELGGKNSMQIGLGTQVSSVTKMFKQGSIETTDKNTDLAIQGDGFFVVSPDGGNTYKYTRNGDFTFDALGNFTDANGYITQGWLRDAQTGEIDSTTPIQNITIPPGLTTPAKSTTVIDLKANLNSGDSIGNSKTAIYSLDSYAGWTDLNGDGIMNISNGATSTSERHNEDVDAAMFDINHNQAIYEKGQDFGTLFDASGKAIGLQEGQGIWASYADAQIEAYAADTAIGNIEFEINGVLIKASLNTADKTANAAAIAKAINDVSNTTGVTATSNTDGKVTITNKNDNGTTDAMKNINFQAVGGSATGLYQDNTLVAGTELNQRDVITAFKYIYSSSTANYVGASRTEERVFNSTEDLRDAMQTDARLNTDYHGNGWSDTEINKNDGVEVTINNAGQFSISNPSGDAFNEDDGDNWDETNLIDFGPAVTPRPLQYQESQTIVDGFTLPAGVTLTLPSGTILPTAASTAGGTIEIGVNATDNGDGTLTLDTSVAVTNSDNTELSAGDITLPTTATLTLPAGTTLNVNNAATYELPAGVNYVDLNDQTNMVLAVTSYTDINTTANSVFTSIIATMQGSLPLDSTGKLSQSIFAASHASSIDIYDSLGSKHTVRLDFVKAGITDDGGMQWDIKITVPKPAVIDSSRTDTNQNIITGSVKFGPNGSLEYFTPTTISFTGNNGSSSNQPITLNLGTIGQFDGMTSFDSASNTSGISQDGYPGGDLSGISVDETGTIIGSFTNGRSFGLAQVAMASFSNNEGLESDGGNTFIQTSNSGDPIIGQASVGGRGAVQASSLEMSNVDLSRSLTQLIVIQRGYQANSKTITTSDEMLNTLLQLK